MLLSRFLTGLTVLLMVCFSFNCAAAQCDSGWFGNNCQYQCHCAGSTECDNGGHCSSGCAENWFGPACQYVAMGLTVGGNNWLIDSDDSTCNDGTIRTIYAALDTPIPLTWVRVVVNDEAYIDQIRLFKKVQNSNWPTHCSELRKAKVDATTIDISCPTTEPVTDVVLDGEGVLRICSLYLNGGRNVALKQSTEQSSNFPFWPKESGASVAVDGRTGVSEDVKSTCTHTSNQGSRGWWRLMFSQPVDVTWFHIYNRDEKCCRDRLDKFELRATSVSNTEKPFVYTDPGITRASYTVVPNYKIDFPVRKVLIDVNPLGNNVILTLCEVFVFGEIQCQPGTFGLQCERNCNCLDQTESCFVHSGGCSSGCAPNYIGEDCSELNCTVGTYGDDCKKTCSVTCGGDNNPCKQKDGACTQGCDPGYTGNYCQSECPVGYYGLDCSKTCSPNCKRSGKVCHHIDGNCTSGCKDGYQGEMCDTVCPTGTYGPSCSKSCNTNCYGQDNACDPINGGCSNGCEDGYYKDGKCDLKCYRGKFGKNCEERCNINCGGYYNECHHVNGNCSNGCDDGYLGKTCNIKCPVGKYGFRCEETCNTKCGGEDDACNHINGYCTYPCDTGYQGNKCDTECDTGKYGDECLKACSRNCKGRYDACHHITGRCTNGCDDGYEGEKCDIECGLGKYGAGCQETCSVHCAGDGDPCDHITGSCTNKCDPGYMWLKCTKECNAGRYGARCSSYCSTNCAGSYRACDHVNGTCDEGCKTGYIGAKCDQECATGYYGDGCKELCSEHCAGNGNPCHHVSGSCDQGCDPGYKESSCTQECPTGRYGLRCSRYCSNYCFGPDHACHHVDGTCDVCSPGYRGKRCELECETGQFGEGCKETCSDHCAGDKNPCHHINGTCDMGCDPGYHGLLCIKECETTKYGQDCALTCSTRCLDSKCNHMNGLCLECPPGYQGGMCDQECNATEFGVGCNQTCSVHCMNQKCHHQTGQCELCVESRTGAFCETMKQRQSGGEDSTIGAVVGVLVVLLVILAIIGGIFFWRRRRNIFSGKQGQEDNINLNQRLEATPQANVTSQTDNSNNQPKRLKTRRTLSTKRKDAFEEESEEDTDDEGVGNQANLLTGNTAVPVEMLKTYILQHSADSHFKDEFTSIPMANSSPQTCGLSAENIKKNRYKNIIPYDATRVLLQVVGGKKSSDYINASHVKGYNNDPTFIASQGPNDLILHDFVRMLWEQEVDRVVMLTNLVELGKKKCSMYWPVDGEEEFGEVTIKLLTTHVFAEYTIRHLCLSKSGEPSRTLTQFHFTAWPDKLVPESPWGLVDLHQRVMAVQGSGPILVHCSAGVGRTGTFIALCNLLQEAEATGKMDFLSALWNLRQDRMHTIQTVAQYAFLHKVALVCYMTAGTTIKVKDMYTSLASLESCQGGNKSARSYKQEFEALLDVCEATTIKSSEASEQQDENIYQNASSAAIKGKDRLSNILPNQAYRPLLTAEAHHEDTYINAVLVPNLTKNSQDILTQLPLPSTVTDFWRLVTQYNVGLVVAFDSESRHTDETIAEFFPTSETQPFENDRFVVETKAPAEGMLATELFLTIHQKAVPGMDSSSNEKKRTLTLLLCKNTQLDPESVLELQEGIKYRRPGGKFRTIYMCRNGADQCGLMCVQSILLERLEVDQCLTVPLVVGTIKAIRPQVIPTVDQYKCLYQVLKLAQDSQNVYGNVGDMPNSL